MEGAAPESGSAAGILPDRWRSALWSQIFPGLGQIHNGRRKLGVSILIGYSLCAAVLFAGARLPAIPTAILLASFVLMLLVWPASIIHAYRGGAGQGQDASNGSAWRAAFWSRWIPGVGQLLERRFAPGLLFLVLLFVSRIPEAPVVSEPLGFAVAMLAILEALTRSKHGRVSLRNARALLLALVLVTIATPVISVAVRSFWVRAFRIPAESMRPALIPGDYVVVDKTRVGRARPGELVVFRYPLDRSKDFVKRCVATSGQRVEIRDKQLWVDGARLAEPYVFHADAAVRPAGLDGRDNLPEIVVPPGHVFVLGDNRDNSNDSRYFGPVPLRDVHGPVVRIYWPPQRWTMLSSGGR